MSGRGAGARGGAGAAQTRRGRTAPLPGLSRAPQTVNEELRRFPRIRLESGETGRETGALECRTPGRPAPPPAGLPAENRLNSREHGSDVPERP